MKEILEVVIKNLVDNPDQIQIEETSDERTIKLAVKVAKEDMGKVIGRDGRIAKAIRSLMKSMGAKEHKRVNVEFLDD